ncbi:uncharacterized protein LOC127241236 [Andrographis paniculata]|uniref:uncharacterized protein LOC127241236 n=1 Tax=Andrographis paniculata TaxID=175694 RepID=UPI0021E6D956|nr:uncharacterized protein LOC127241236 [Andrographis paniculata]
MDPYKKGDVTEISVHCSSKDHDIGTHIVRPHADFNFSVCNRFWADSKWTCDIALVLVPRLHVKIEAFTSKMAGDFACGMKRQCYWDVNGYGFFFGEDLRKMKKKYDWPLNGTLSDIGEKKKMYGLSRGPSDIGF